MSTERKGQKGFRFVDSSILFLFFQTGSREEIKKVEHVQRDEAEEEDEEETKDELRSSNDDIHFGGGLVGSGKISRIVALEEASARNGGGKE